jgi:processive 1,2-diacylglycerol beta-glucosyltransferase
MADPSTYARVKENFLKLRYDEDPTLLIDEIVGLANDVAQAQLQRRAFPPANGQAASA